MLWIGTHTNVTAYDRTRASGHPTAFRAQMDLSPAFVAHNRNTFTRVPEGTGGVPPVLRLRSLFSGLRTGCPARMTLAALAQHGFPCRACPALRKLRAPQALASRSAITSFQGVGPSCIA